MTSHGTSWSMAKSYYAALIGISIDKGEIGSLDDAVAKYLDYFKELSSDNILEERKSKFLKIGRGKGFISKPDELTTLKFQSRKLDEILKSKKFLLLLKYFETS